MTKEEYESIIAGVRTELDHEMKRRHAAREVLDADSLFIGVTRGLLYEMIIAAGDYFAIYTDIENARLFGIKVKAIDGLEVGAYLMRKTEPIWQQDREGVNDGSLYQN